MKDDGVSANVDFGFDELTHPPVWMGDPLSKGGAFLANKVMCPFFATLDRALGESAREDVLSPYIQQIPQ